MLKFLLRMVRRVLRLPYVALLLAPLALFAPAILSGKALFWGTPLLQFGPWRTWAWEMLRQGIFPLWDPLVGMGAPLVANYQSALFYPPNWLLLPLVAIAGAPALAWGQTLLVAFHLVFAGWGMARLVQRLGMGVLAQAVGGLAFGLSGYLTARAGFLSINATVAWMPWIILAVTPETQAVSTAHRPGLRRFLGLVVLLAMQLLAGHAQTTWYTLLLAGLWAGFWALCPLSSASPRSIQDRTSPSPNSIPIQGEGEIISTGGIRQRGKGLLVAWGSLALAILLAVALSAVQLLPVAEYLGQSQRASQVDFNYVTTYSFWPWRFLTLLAPGLFGSPASGNYWGYANYWEDAVYIGLLPLLLASGALLRRSRAQLRLRLFLGGLVVLSFALALGSHTPLFPWLYRHVPTFNLFQAPARFSLWAEFALGVLAALGAENWSRPQGFGLYWTRLATMGALAVALGADLAYFLLDLQHPSFIRATALLGFLGVVAGLLALNAPGRAAGKNLTLNPFPEGKGLQTGGLLNNGRLRFLPFHSGKGPGVRSALSWSSLVTLFISVDLLIAAWGLNPVQPASLYRTGTAAASDLRALLGGGRLFLRTADEQALKFERYLRFDTFQPPAGTGWEGIRSVFLPNVNLLDGIASANNFDPLLPDRYSRWMEALENTSAGTRERLLNLMAVSVVENIDPGSPLGVRFDRRETFPIVRWLPCTRLVQPGSALEAVISDGWDPQTEVILESSQKPPVSGNALLPLPGTGSGEGESLPTCPASARAQLSNLQMAASSISVTIRSESPGYLLVAQTWYPGWQAFVDGETERIQRGNYLFQAVPVPAGEHALKLVYRPTWFYIGVVVSSLSWLFLLLIYRLKRPHPQDQETG